VRWVLIHRFLSKDLIEKHSNPDKSGFADEDDAPFKKNGHQKGFYAHLSERWERGFWK